MRHGSRARQKYNPVSDTRLTRTEGIPDAKRIAAEFRMHSRSLRTYGVTCLYCHPEKILNKYTLNFQVLCLTQRNHSKEKQLTIAVLHEKVLSCIPFGRSVSGALRGCIANGKYLFLSSHIHAAAKCKLITVARIFVGAYGNLPVVVSQKPELG